MNDLECPDPEVMLHTLFDEEHVVPEVGVAPERECGGHRVGGRAAGPAGEM